MSDGFSVNLDDLDQIVTKLTGLNGYITDVLDEIGKKVATLKDGTWESVAATAYAEAHTKWAAGATEFATGVSDIATVAKDAHGHYTTAVDTNGTMLGGK